MGDWVIADGKVGLVEAIEFGYEPQWMYNLTVDTAHTFFVGEGRWLVHNACGIAKFGYDEQLRRYVGKIPGTSFLGDELWTDITKGFTTDPIQAPLEAMKNARQINFIVDGINLDRLSSGDNVFTHWEMDQIIARGYTGKLHLWKGGAKLDEAKVKKWISAWKSKRPDLRVSDVRY